MGSTQKYLFPAALLGSLIVAVLGFTVTSGFTSPPSSILSATDRQSHVQTSIFLPAVTQMYSVPPNQILEVEPDQQTPTHDNPGSDFACQVSSKYPDKIRQWCQWIHQYSKQNNLDPDLIAALIWQESGGDPVAYSRSGAVGLMQVMPRDGIASSFMCKNGPCFTNRPTINELQNPEFNIKYGTRMLANLQSHYGNLRDALKYYGPMDVGYSYADKVLNIYNNYKQ
jgi:hypothetical protein